MTESSSVSTEHKLVLNVGGGTKDYKLPEFYDGYAHVLLDMDNSYGEVDVVMDATKLHLWEGNLVKFDAVYCSHNLEHYYIYDVIKVLRGMFAVLKPGGTVDIRVPDLLAVAQAIVDGEDIYGETSAKDHVIWHDCLYGSTIEILRRGEHWAHKTGFTEEALRRLLTDAGFVNLQFARGRSYELAVLGYKPGRTACPVVSSPTLSTLPLASADVEVVT